MEQSQKQAAARAADGFEDVLIAEWERRARKKFADAEEERNPMGRRLIEHGAWCYFNAAQELKAVVRGAS